MEREAMERLKQHEARKVAVENLRREWETTGNPERRRAVAAALKQTRARVMAVEQGLGTLTEEQRLILTVFFIRPVREPALWLCGELGCEVASVYRRRRKALRDFAVAMFGEG